MLPQQWRGRQSVHRGQQVLEQTFIVSRSVLVTPQISPIGVFEK